MKRISEKCGTTFKWTNIFAMGVPGEEEKGRKTVKYLNE